MPDLHALGADALLAGYAAGRFTPCDVIEAVVDRISAWEPHLCALYAYDPEGARIMAAESAMRWRAGAPLGALDGVPVTLKELIATRGTPVPQGSAGTELVPAASDAPPAARLREAGAIILAKTTVPDLGMLSSGVSSFHALARNPWDLATNPGGSSAGAAAAAAAGYGPLHVGTDIGGSVRLPAAWCGLVGFKPTLGRIPIDPYYTGRCAGPMTRTVADAGRLMHVLARPDARDATSLPYQPIDWTRPLTGGPGGLRIGLMQDPGCGMPLDPEIADAVEAAALLFERNGAVLVRVPGVLTRDIVDGIDRYWRARAWGDIAMRPTTLAARILPYILDWARPGADVTGPDAIAGFGRTFDLRRSCARLFEAVDVVLSPTTPNLAFPADWASPLNDPGRPFEHIAYTLPWNMSEQPAISLNCGFSSAGTPIGLQIVTRRFEDLQAVQLAGWFETQRGPITCWPEPPSFRTGPAPMSFR